MQWIWNKFEEFVKFYLPVTLKMLELLSGELLITTPLYSHHFGILVNWALLNHSHSNNCIGYNNIEFKIIVQFSCFHSFLFAYHTFIYIHQFICANYKLCSKKKKIQNFINWGQYLWIKCGYMSFPCHKWSIKKSYGMTMIICKIWDIGIES